MRTMVGRSAITSSLDIIVIRRTTGFGASRSPRSNPHWQRNIESKRRASCKFGVRRGGQVGATFAQAPLIKASPYRARASRPARQLLLSCRATPALRGGEFVFFTVTRLLNSDDRGQQGHRACVRR